MARERRPLSILLAVLRMLLNHPAHRVNFARISCLKILRYRQQLACSILD
jgi:hypothetical protein